MADAILPERPAPAPDLATPGEVLLMDFAAVAYPIWAACQGQPDPNTTHRRIIARVGVIASLHRLAALCCDSGPSFRKTLDPTYKAQREPAAPGLFRQMDLAKAELALRGFPVWAKKGFEADDLIAAAAAVFTANPTGRVVIVAADKDLLQLVTDRVRVWSPATGVMYTPALVVERYGVRPDQMVDYLTLVGDASDNIRGAEKVGPMTAAKLLTAHQTIDGVYRALATPAHGLPPKLVERLRAFESRVGLTRRLITLRTDVDLPFDDINEPRTPRAPLAALRFDPDDDEADFEEAMTKRKEIVQAEVEAQQAGLNGAVSGATAGDAVESAPADAAADASAAPSTDRPSAPLDDPPREAGPTEAALPAVVPAGAYDVGGAAIGRPAFGTAADVAPSPGPSATDLVLAPSQWERALDPVTMKDARRLALDLHESGLFSNYGTPQAVLSTVMVGRELGLPAMASLRGIHIIEDKHALSAQLMVAIVLKSGFAEYFELVASTDKLATFVTKRRGARDEVTLTHTLAMAAQAGLLKDNSNWMRMPVEMCMARAQSRLCRLVYPDLLAGLYTPDELIEAAAVGKAA